MNKNKFIVSVCPTSKPRNYPQPIFQEKKELERRLNLLGYKILINNSLKGGTVSQVYSGEFNGKKVVVKHVDNLIPFDPTEFFISKNGFNIDVKILRKLGSVDNIKVPKIIKLFSKEKTVVLEDLRENGFILLSDLIISGKLKIDSAFSIGKSLATLAYETRKWKEFSTNESAEQSIYERGLELRLSYPNSQNEYLALEKEFTGNDQYFCWPDSHPKNIFVNDRGECAFIDFGRSIWADQKYMLPNFLAHIVLYSLAGYINKKLAAEYLKMCIRGYNEILPVDENIFCKYLAMEVLHRNGGKWITGIEKKEQKVSLYKFGLTVFDEGIGSINKLLTIL